MKREKYSPRYLYRGVCIDKAKPTPDPFSLDFYEEGKEFRLPAFTSTSTSKSTAETFSHNHGKCTRASLVFTIEVGDSLPLPL